MVEAERRVIVLTEPDMCRQCKKEAGGRAPPEIEFVCAKIPEPLRARLLVAGSRRMKFPRRPQQRTEMVRPGHVLPAHTIAKRCDNARKCPEMLAVIDPLP